MSAQCYVTSTSSPVTCRTSDAGFPCRAAVRMQYAFAPTLGAALNVTLLSYVDTCALGINADTGAIPDFDVFYECLVAGFDEVLALAD